MQQQSINSIRRIGMGAIRLLKNKRDILFNLLVANQSLFLLHCCWHELMTSADRGKLILHLGRQVVDLFLR